MKTCSDLLGKNSEAQSRTLGELVLEPELTGMGSKYAGEKITGFGIHPRLVPSKIYEYWKAATHPERGYTANWFWRATGE
jgi:hypothetical protein